MSKILIFFLVVNPSDGTLWYRFEIETHSLRLNLLSYKYSFDRRKAQCHEMVLTARSHTYKFAKISWTRQRQELETVERSRFAYRALVTRMSLISRYVTFFCRRFVIIANMFALICKDCMDVTIIWISRYFCETTKSCAVNYKLIRINKAMIRTRVFYDKITWTFSRFFISTLIHTIPVSSGLHENELCRLICVQLCSYHFLNLEEIILKTVDGEEDWTGRAAAIAFPIIELSKILKAERKQTVQKPSPHFLAAHFWSFVD